MYKFGKRAVVAIVVGAAWTASLAVAAEPGAPARPHVIGAAAAAEPQDVVANVEGSDITRAEYATYYAAFARQRFYHRQPPANEVEALKIEVLERLILFRLLLIETERRHIQIDETSIDKQIAAIRGKIAPGAALDKFESQVSNLRRELQGSARVSVLEKEIRKVSPASGSELQTYYTENRKLFTEPARERIRTILLGVQPWEPEDVWKSAELKATEVVKKLKAGQAFEALAKQYSTHESAQTGGDLGYLHKGMLNANAEAMVAELAPGRYTDPIRTLEGYVVFQLVDRTPARVQSFEEVSDRVAALRDRELSEDNWRKFTSRLRQDAAVKIAENLFPDSSGPR